MSCFFCFSKNDTREQQSTAMFPRKDAVPTVKIPEQQPPLRTSHGTNGKKDTGNGNIAARTFTFRELASATKNFRPECLIGEGGFGRVYKGCIENTREIVAIKQLDTNGFQGSREFLVEVLMLSLLHHPNLIKLIGFCSDGDQKLLVYEFMAKGSLEDHLLDLSPDQKHLDWSTRMKIATGAAKGVEYLHDKANPPVIYRDLKSSNILLDDEFNPKLSDFGLAKLGPQGEDANVSSQVRGTYGYCSPEYVRTGRLTLKSDVYSFGVVLLELITGRRALDTTKPTIEQDLVAWAQPIFKDKKRIHELVDPLLQGDYPASALNQAIAVAALCLEEEPMIRPLMADVVQALSFLSSDPSKEDSVPSPSPSYPSQAEEIFVQNEDGEQSLRGGSLLQREA